MNFPKDGLNNWQNAMEKTGFRPGGTEMVIRHSDGVGPGGDWEKPTITVCAVCDIVLNEVSFNGEQTFLHARAWQKYDHEPVVKEIPRGEHQGSLCDFCGLDNGNVWVFEGNQVQAETGNGIHDYGRSWGSCAECAPFVVDKDIDGLLDRIMRVGPIASAAATADKPQIRAAMLGLLGPYVDSVSNKTWIGPKRQPGRLDPRMMPKILAGLHKFWGHPNTYERMSGALHTGRNLPALSMGGDDNEPGMFMVRYGPGQAIDPQAFARHVDHLHAGFNVSDLYWISAEFTQLAIMAGHDLDRLMITREELPSPFGLMVWEAPIGEIKRPGGDADIRAVSWTLVPGGVWFSIYMQGEDADPEIDTAWMRSEYGFLMSPNPGVGLEFSYDLGAIKNVGGMAQTVVTTLLSTMFLLQQPGVAEVSTAPVDKKLARSLARTGQKTPEVKLIDLRRRTRRSRPAESVEGGWTLQYRRFTKGHWKRQFYGPKRGLRKTIYVSPYVSGDEHLPLRPDTPPTVKVLR